jgi:cell division septation protein DedD
MRGVFDDRQVQQAQASRDTEITLNPTMLFVLAFGLLTVCAVCFGFGYSMGHRAGPDTNLLLQTATGEPLPPSDSGHPKPSADAQTASPVPASSTADDGTPSTAGASVESAAVAAAGGSSSAAAQVKPALTDGPAVMASAAIPSSTSVAPAMSAGLALMVQIAAVSEQDDADVLMGALRKRGYAVAGHREPLDGLIHVRIGPFKSRDEADKWRDKLLGDGYNAIVQP